MSGVSVKNEIKYTEDVEMDDGTDLQAPPFERITINSPHTNQEPSRLSSAPSNDHSSSGASDYVRHNNKRRFVPEERQPSEPILSFLDRLHPIAQAVAPERMETQVFNKLYFEANLGPVEAYRFRTHYEALQNSIPRLELELEEAKAFIIEPVHRAKYLQCLVYRDNTTRMTQKKVAKASRRAREV